jgi:FG-GAP repeat
VATINNPGPAAGEGFGHSVAIDGAVIAIGTPLDDTVFTDKGYAYVFTSDADGDGLLDGWEIAHFGTITGHSALDDTDGDGRNELLELAFGTNPLASDAAAAPLPVDEDGFLTMTIAKRPGINREVQSAGTLLPALSDSFSSATTTVLIDAATTLKVRDNVRIDTAPARFLRTKLTAAP